MASGHGYTRNTDYGSGSRDSNQNSSAYRLDPIASAQMTQELVGEFKRTLQDRIDHGNTINQQEVEHATFNAKHTLHEEQNNIVKLKRALPEDLRGVQHNLLLMAMAYNNDPADIITFCRSELRENPRGNGADGQEKPSVFLDEMIEPLKKLKSDFKRSSPPHPYASVHEYDKKDLLRATRLLYSEAHHMLPHLRDFSFDDAEEMVQAFRESSYEMTDKYELNVFLKTCRRGEASDMMRGMESQFNKNSGQTTTSESSRGDRPSDRDGRYGDQRSGTFGSPSAARRPDDRASSNDQRSDYSSYPSASRFN